jgi:hypothetical protein
MRLYELSGTAEQPQLSGAFITLDYAPEEWTDAKATDWKDEDKDVCVGALEFDTSHGRVLAMTLFFNDWGEDDAHRGAPKLRVEEKIAWLRLRQCPKDGSIAGDASPPVLALVWREFFKCVLTKVDVTRTKLHPLTLDAIRATVDIELKEFVGEAQ